MNYVRVMGGLGNQLFCYAFAEFLRQLGKENIELEFGFYEYIQKPGEDPMRENMLDYLGLPYRKAPSVIHPDKIITEENLEEGLKATDNVIFIGMWQDRDIASYAEAFIRDHFHPAESDLSQGVIKLAMEMASVPSVSLHIRRTDYLDKANEKTYVKLSMSYYENAVSHIIDRLGTKPDLFVFSDDPEWAESNIKDFMGCHTTIVKGNEAFQDLWLMTKCQHSIIANSTFSWWGAFLREEQSGYTIVPSRWFLDRQDYDLYFDDYIKIDP